jgi:charged multivesicular body protein 1
MGNKVSLEDELINLKIVSKQMQRSAKKCEKSEKEAIEKVKKVGVPFTSLTPFCSSLWA